MLVSLVMLDGLFGSQNYTAAKLLMDATEVRQRALSANLANLQTPGYQRVDIDPAFAATLRSHLQDGSLDARSKMPEPTVRMDPEAGSIRPDGSNVILERELMEVNRNALQYEFLTQYVSSSILHLRTAITGRNSA